MKSPSFSRFLLLASYLLPLAYLFPSNPVLLLRLCSQPVSIPTNFSRRFYRRSQGHSNPKNTHRVNLVWSQGTPPLFSNTLRVAVPANPHQHRPAPTDCSICIRPPPTPSITTCRSSCNHFANCGNLVAITQGPTASRPFPLNATFCDRAGIRPGHSGSTHVFVSIAPRYYPPVPGASYRLSFLNPALVNRHHGYY